MSMQILNVVTPATTDVIDLDEMKSHLFIQPDDSSQDDYISALMASAREFLERETGKVLLSETWSETLDRFPSPWWPSNQPVPGYDPASVPYTPYSSNLWASFKIELQKNPAKTVTWIKYYDTSNVQQTLASNQYTLVPATYLPAIVVPLTVWPATYPRPNAVEIKYDCGFTNLPPIAAQAIRLLVGQWYSFREDQVGNTTLQSQVAGMERILQSIRNL